MESRMAIVMCHPDVPDIHDEGCVARLGWLRKFIPNANIHHWARPELDLKDTWDTAVRELVLTAPKEIKSVMFLHDDTIPDDRSDVIWDSDEDAVCCRYEVPDRPWLWRSRKEFHNALCLIKRKVFEVVPESWWDWDRHPDTKHATGCHCMGFAKRAREYLFTTANTGECGHLNRRRIGAHLPPIPKGLRFPPPASVSKTMWDRNMKRLRKQKADRLKEIRNGN